MANPIKLKAIVDSIHAYGDEGVYEVSMIPEGFVPRYKPGQFLHLTIDDYDPAGGFWPESRVFSIASSWGSSCIRIVYSVKGAYTKRIEETLRVGSVVWLKLPYGSFVIDGALRPDQGAVLVAGGTGVSPFLPFLENQMKDGAVKREVRLYYGARKNAMLLGMGVIGTCAANGVSAFVYIEDETPVCTAPVKGLSGRLDIGMIKSDCTSMNNPAYFLSGPPQMIRAFKQTLLTGGLPAENIFIDEWE